MSIPSVHPDKTRVHTPLKYINQMVCCHLFSTLGILSISLVTSLGISGCQKPLDSETTSNAEVIEEDIDKNVDENIDTQSSQNHATATGLPNQQVQVNGGINETVDNKTDQQTNKQIAIQKAIDTESDNENSIGIISDSALSDGSSGIASNDMTSHASDKHISANKLPEYSNPAYANNDTTDAAANQLTASDDFGNSMVDTEVVKVDTQTDEDQSTRRTVPQPTLRAFKAPDTDSQSFVRQASNTRSTTTANAYVSPKPADKDSLLTNEVMAGSPEATVKNALDTLYYGDAKKAVQFYQVNDMPDFDIQLQNTQNAFRQTVEKVTIKKTYYNSDKTEATLDGEIKLKGMEQSTPMTYKLKKVKGQWKILG